MVTGSLVPWLCVCVRWGIMKRRLSEGYQNQEGERGRGKEREGERGG